MPKSRSLDIHARITAMKGRRRSPFFQISPNSSENLFIGCMRAFHPESTVGEKVDNDKCILVIKGIRTDGKERSLQRRSAFSSQHAGKGRRGGVSPCHDSWKSSAPPVPRNILASVNRKYTTFKSFIRMIIARSGW